MRPDTDIEDRSLGAAPRSPLDSGGVVGVCGPDGVGKTTLCEALVADVLAGREVLHVRFPRLLPRRDPVKRRELRLGPGVTLSDDPRAFPERVYPPPYSRLQSLAKTGYLFVDFWLGWMVNVRPLLRRGGWIVFERGWWDHAVDARRYRLRSPQLIRALGRLLPAWDLVLVLDAPPDLIRARKPELPVAEIERQARAWRAVFPRRQRRTYLDASRPADEVLEQARAAITEVARTKPALTPVRAAGAPTEGRPRRLGQHGSAAPDRWVLVSDGARNRSALAAVRALAAGGYRPAVASSGRSLAGASRHCARAVAVPSSTEPGYAEALRARATSGDYLTALAASDRALLALDAPGSHLLDKEVMSRCAAEAGLEVPPSRSFSSAEELLARAPELDYPVVVKPTVERYPPRRFESAADLSRESWGRDGAVLVQPFLDDHLTAVSGVIWQGRLVAAVHQRYLRIWPEEIGTVCAAETTAPDERLNERLVRLLAGYDGIFQIQFIGRYLLDVHPRVHGSMPLAEAAGANLAALYCDLLRGEGVAIVSYREGTLYRWLESDLAHIAGALRSGRMGAGAALAALRPRRGTAHSTESLTDPGPLLARLRLRGG